MRDGHAAFHAIVLPMEDLSASIKKAIEQRKSHIDPNHRATLRLFNGFYESNLDVTVDFFGATALITNHTQPPVPQSTIQDFLIDALPWLQCILLKTRHSPNPVEKNGLILFGSKPNTSILEGSVTYALDLTLHQDASFYLDTRNLRAWLKEHATGWQVLNAFAYTGSLGAAALAGRAQRVIQLDRSRQFLEIARRTYALNHFPIRREDFLCRDFFPAVGALRREGAVFDCVILDAPYFSTTPGGRVDLENQPMRLINKVRPLVRDGSWLIAINNSLFLSGADYVHQLEEMGADGYLKLEEIIPVPEDITGYPETIVRQSPVDPAPFNHPTKIAVLKVRRKA
jgi:23S rRNA (cytosine1962-C5)-methyltransferase